MRKIGRLEVGARFMQDHGITILLGVVPNLGFALVGMFGEWGMNALAISIFSITFIVQIVLVVVHIEKELAQSELEQQLEEAGERFSELEERCNFMSGNIETLSTIVLFRLSRELGYGNYHRISIFMHHEGRFNLIARFSENPHYNHKGSIFYPENEGFIGQGWSKGEFHIENLPDPFSDPKGYLTLVRQCGIKRETLERLQMRCRSTFVARLRTSDEFNTLGVITFESTLPFGIDVPLAKEKLVSLRSELNILIESRKGMRQTKERGF